LLDIETAPHKVYAWGLWKQDIYIDRIIEPGFTMCMAAKWYGKKKVHFLNFMQEPDAIQQAYDLLLEADMVIHYNGTKFDIPRLHTEFIKAGMPPLPKIPQIDLLRTVRKEFGFPSNKLDYVAKALGLEGKVQHKGFELWRECMQGDDKAWKQMRKYNVQDVLMMEPLYERIRPWIRNHPNLALFVDADDPTCPNCASTRLQKRGMQRTRTRTYQRYQCQDCGAWHRSRRQKESPQEGVLT
jgi:DNA polymerase elongation subunit (family B)/predicted RNA-binding Zn-ribbon protein involved in translation (DUF1610 family)